MYFRSWKFLFANFISKTLPAFCGLSTIYSFYFFKITKLKKNFRLLKKFLQNINWYFGSFFLDWLEFFNFVSTLLKLHLSCKLEFTRQFRILRWRLLIVARFTIKHLKNFYEISKTKVFNNLLWSGVMSAKLELKA